MQVLPGLNQLGCGYDATKLYACPDSVRSRIFTLGRMDGTIDVPNDKTYSCPTNLAFEFGNKSKGSFECIKGKTAEEYRKSLETKAGVSGSYGLFSMDVKNTYKKEELASFNHEFVSVHHRFDLYKLSLPPTAALTMTPEADAAINTGPAANVFKTYGTHVLMSGIVGGRAEYNCLVDSSKYTSKVEIATAAEAAYKGALKLSTTFDHKTTEAMEKFKSSSTSRFETLGGDFKKDLNAENFLEWTEAFKKNPVLVDFTDDSLIPIYELARLPQRREALAAEYATYVQKSSQLVSGDVPALEVMIVSGRDVAHVSSDSGSRAKGDLNIYKPAGARGEWRRWLGHSGNTNQNLVIVKALVPGAIADPIDYQDRWNDAGSNRDSGYSLWNIVAPPDYRALGGIARLGTARSDHNKPSGGEVENLACVHSSLCTEGVLGPRTWHDEGTRARKNGSVWGIFANGNGGLGASTFYSHDNWGRPSEKVYVLTRGNRVIVK